MAYFEFLPVHRKREAGGETLDLPKILDEKEREELVELVDVKLGQEYELVVTTYAGTVWARFSIRQTFLCVLYAQDFQLDISFCTRCTRFLIRHFFVYYIGVNVP